MTIETFTANVQYDDLLGTVAADHSDNDDIRSWLIEEEYIDEEELVWGIEIYTGQIFLEEEKPFQVTVYVGDESRSYMNQIKVALSLEAFVSSFKRLHVMLSMNGELTGEELEINDIRDLDDE